MANPVKSLGKGITYVGKGAVFLMAVVGAVAIDIVILEALSKESRRDRGDNGFLTGYLFGLMWSNNQSNNRNFYENAAIMLLISPLLTTIAVALSFALGVPEVGIALIAGWAGAFSIIAVGMAVCAVSDILEHFVSSLFGSNQRNDRGFTSLFRSIPRDDLGFSNTSVVRPEAGNEHSWNKQQHFDSPLYPKPTANPAYEPTMFDAPPPYSAL